MSPQVYDVVVVGAGAAGMTAAAVAAAEKLRVLLVESTPLVGGTSAVSGGMVWVPANHKLGTDTIEAAREYLTHTVPGSAGAAAREAYLARADEALRYLEAHTSVRLSPVMVYPDYYPEFPGATPGGRVMEPVPFDGAALGARFPLLRPPLPEFTLFGGMMISRADIPHLRRVYRAPRSAARVARLLLRHARERLGASRGTTLYLGNALAARLLKSVLDLGVDLRLAAPAASLTVEGGRVTGVLIGAGCGSPAVKARRAVILATGGLSRDPELRGLYFPKLAGEVTATVASAASPGARLALTAGAHIATGAANGAFWVPGSCFRREDGSPAVFPHTVTDRAKPGLIAVDKTGRRFVNEARSYHEFVLAQLNRGEVAIPAFLVCDSRFLWKYGLGRVKPFTFRLAGEVSSGYLRRAGTLEGLAAAIGVPPDAFRACVEAYNAAAERGADPEFGRGGDIYQRHLGDAEVTPNPCVAPILAPPFYAIAVVPADLGASAGLLTDARARVLTREGRPIPGLYACGNDMNSVMNGGYPGPGITLGPALTFGYIAAREAAAS